MLLVLSLKQTSSRKRRKKRDRSRGGGVGEDLTYHPDQLVLVANDMVCDRFCEQRGKGREGGRNGTKGI